MSDGGMLVDGESPSLDISPLEAGEYVGGAKLTTKGQKYQFAKAEVTELDMKCALMLRRGLGVAESIRGSYGEVSEQEARKYRTRAQRGWYTKIRLSDMPDTVKADVRNMQVVTTRGDGVVEKRPMTQKEMAEFIWKKSESVRVLTEIAKADDSKKMEKIAAVKELNAMHGFYAPAQVNVTIGLADVVKEVNDRKRVIIMAQKVGAGGDIPVYELDEFDIGEEDAVCEQESGSTITIDASRPEGSE